MGAYNEKVMWGHIQHHLKAGIPADKLVMGMPFYGNSGAGSQISLEETARRTGFYNVAALIRVFKKIEDMTPGQYRDSVGNGQNLNSDK